MPSISVRRPGEPVAAAFRHGPAARARPAAFAGVKAVALLDLDGVDDAFQAVALLGDHVGIVHILLAQAGLERVSRRLIDPRASFGIRPLGAFSAHV